MSAFSQQEASATRSWPLEANLAQPCAAESTRNPVAHRADTTSRRHRQVLRCSALRPLATAPALSVPESARGRSLITLLASRLEVRPERTDQSSACMIDSGQLANRMYICAAIDLAMNGLSFDKHLNNSTLSYIAGTKTASRRQSEHDSALA